jgi:protein PhnA
MNLESNLQQRSGAQCELCGGKNNLQVYQVLPAHADQQPEILACEKCLQQINSTENLDAHHWRCLNNTIWSEIPAIQVISWRILYRLQQQGETWAQDLLDQLYLDEPMTEWAKASVREHSTAEEKIIHKDSNGNILQDGDTVVLIKDLDVKGAGFTAKRGTPVRAISLVENNAGQIEGKVNGQQIVILTQYVKKS